jgi:hypothetical protein
MRSELANADFSLHDYDRIVLCQPLWAFHPVPAVNAFFARSDLHGKSKRVERKMLESLDAWVGTLPRKD